MERHSGDTAIGVIARAVGSALLVGVAVTLFGDAIGVRIDQWIIFGLLTLSLSFVWGEAGIFSFGQSVFFGFAAYAYGAFAKNVMPSTGESVSAIIVGVIVGTVIAGLLGYFMFYGGVTDVYVAVITLAATLIMFILMGSTAGPTWRIGEAPLGGFNGMTGVPALQVGDAVLARSGETYALIAAVTITFIALRLFMRSPRGRIAAGIGDNDERAELLGYDARWYRWLVFVVGGAVASLAGVLFASSESIVTPQVFGMGIVGTVVISAMVGGRSLLLGGIVGAAIIGYLTAYIDQFTILEMRPFQNQTPLVLGVLLLAIVLLLPRGIVPGIASVVEALPWRLRPGRKEVPQHVEAGVAQLDRGVKVEIDPARPLLEAQGLSKAFGGLQAVNGVSLSLFPGETRCLVGPNGAGKSTLFSLLVGRHAPDTGKVTVAGRDLTAEPVFRRIQEGLGIKLQIPSIFRGLPVRENLWLAAYGAQRSKTEADEAVPGLLDWLSLSDQADLPAGALPHGKQQWLEIGMVLATRPQIILLDEPTAGMTREETDEMVGLVRRLSEHAAVIVVEHDMEFIRKLESPLTALVEGEILVEGSWDDLRRDTRVLAAYLGGS